MNKVIKSFEKFNDDQQEAIYDLYLGGNLEKASFPFKGEIEEGVIYDDDASTIKASKLSTSDDNDDDDDDDVEGIEDDVEVMEDDDVLEGDEQ